MRPTTNAKSPALNGSSAFWLLGFVILVVAIGIAIGFATAPGAWYETLAKPIFNPPPWVFGPVWTVIYILIAVAGWRIWMIAPKSGAMGAWALQMALNWLWSPIFFGAEMPWLAFAIIVVLLGAIALFIVLARRIDKVAAWLFAPYALWVAFATLLNGSIAVMN
ncbi:TspO/MBR family protein [Inquilinus sp. CAU 1745]|uniref:TspO/MBR family protein n=1 Tax=Inquilinus sp. CAU 1745 TaxID=3140369 RepID=UPI00325A98D6